EGLPGDPSPLSDTSTELAQRLDAAVTVDAALVTLLEQQTHTFRLLDRRLGAATLLAQTRGHVEQITGLLAPNLPSGQRGALGAAGAEAAALAGWQALDQGDPARSWALHEVAKAAARESEDAAILAHVTAQQAYALLDLGRPQDALAVVR